MDRGAPGSELYALDPEQFTAARNALVKQLRSEGRREDAAAVARLRRPPATAWALNEVARERPELVEEVLEAGEKLRAAMERAVAGDASALRGAQLGERRALDAATAAAAGRLESTGRAGGDAARQRMAASLRAAVMDPSVAEAVVAGVLDADHDAPGFGLEGLAVRSDASGAPGGPDVETGRAEVPAAPTPDEEGESKGRDTRRQRERLAAAADEAEQRARDTERTAAAGERRARELRAAADVAAAEADRAVRRARESASAAGAAERTAERDRATAAQAAEQAAAARGRAGAGD